jgi:hypothetical protein
VHSLATKETFFSRLAWRTTVSPQAWIPVCLLKGGDCAFPFPATIVAKENCRTNIGQAIRATLAWLQSTTRLGMAHGSKACDVQPHVLSQDAGMLVHGYDPLDRDNCDSGRDISILGLGAFDATGSLPSIEEPTKWNPFNANCGKSSNDMATGYAMMHADVELCLMIFAPGADEKQTF